MPDVMPGDDGLIIDDRQEEPLPDLTDDQEETAPIPSPEPSTDSDYSETATSESIRDPIEFDSQPVPPYTYGDRWLNGQSTYVCVMERGENESFNVSDWSLIEAEQIVTPTTRQVTNHYEELIDAFDSDSIAKYQSTGAVPYELYDDGTMVQVTWADVHDLTPAGVEFVTEAESIALANNQHFWSRTTDDGHDGAGTGALVTDEERDDFLAAAKLGFPDLGDATASDLFTADGTTATFALSQRAASDTAIVVRVNGAPVTSGLTKTSTAIMFATAPVAGALVRIDYDTNKRPWHNVLINSLGFLLRMGLIDLATFTRSAVAFFDGNGNAAPNVLARFGIDGAQIGKSDAEHVTIDAQGLKAYDANGNLARVNTVDVVATNQAATAAQQAADAAQSSADDAATAATAAQTSADDAATAAAAAQADATRANTSAADALAQLTVVQDVAGTLDWISSHGSYVAATDTTVQDGTVYFELEDGEYVPVTTPTGNPASQGWYVLSVTDSQTDYIMAHLAVTNAGLWVLPSGMGQSQTPQGAPGYKMLLASDGVYLYDGSGHLVTTYGESITFDSSRPQYIGGDDAFITFYDSDSDGVPDSIWIGGSRVTIGSGGASLEQVVADAQGTLIYDHTYQYNEARTHVTFTAYLYRGGVDVKSEYDPSQFLWYYKTEDDDTLHPIGVGYGYTCTVDVSLMGYGGHVVGKFVQQADVNLQTSDGEDILDSQERQLLASVEAEGAVRISDIAVTTQLVGTDRILVTGSEGESTATLTTLQAYINANVPKEVLFGTTAQWDAQVSLTSQAGVLYVYTDHAQDSQGNPVAGIKAGDGNAYLIDLPFTDAVLMEHIADDVRHITAAERAAWNAKVRCYTDGSERLIFTTS